MNWVVMSHKIQQATKTILDLLICISALILLIPFIIVISLAIKLDSSGPAIYRHRRIGRDGRSFDLYKFRTMVHGGDDTGYMNYLKELIESEKDGNQEPLPYRKMDVDERVTRLGRFLRNYYLDEIPQIFNILEGNMSLVGPRPHVHFEVDNYTDEQYRRLSVKPGITGLWQVAGKTDCTFSELIQFDLDYIDDWSLKQDIMIMYNTLQIIFHGGEKFWARKEKHVPN